MAFTLATLKDAPEILIGSGVRLERIQPRHAAAFCELYASSAQDMDFVKSATGDWTLERAMANCVNLDSLMTHGGGLLCYLAFVGDTSTPLATIDLHSFILDIPCCQLGYVGNSHLTGRGLVSHAAQLAVLLAFALGIHRIEAWCDSRNTRSIRMAQRLGFQREGEFRHMERDSAGLLCNQTVLSLLSTDPRPTLPPVVV